MANDNRTIGKFHLDGLPPARRGIPQIEVIFDIDANGIINVSAVDKATNKQQSIRIESSSGLSKEEIERMKQEAELNAESDKKLKEEVDVLNSADSLMFQIEKSMEDLEGKISDEDKEQINSSVEKLRESHSSRNIEEVKSLTNDLNIKFQVISKKLYNESNQTETSDTPTEEDYTNVEFEEVK